MKRCEIPPALLLFENASDIDLVLSRLALLGIRELAGSGDPSHISAYSSGPPIALPGHCAFIEGFENLLVSLPYLFHPLPSLVWSGPHYHCPGPWGKHFDNGIQVVPVDGIVVLLK